MGGSEIGTTRRSRTAAATAIWSLATLASVSMSSAAWADCADDVRDATVRLAEDAPSPGAPFAITDARHLLEARRLLDADGSEAGSPEGEDYCRLLLEGAERDLGVAGKQPISPIPALGSGADHGLFRR